MPAKQIPLHQPIMVPYKLLEFDRKNPRFAGELGGKLPDQEIINYFNERSDLLELVQSITSSTYIQIEPLVVLSEGESLTVLEGNRRLAAIKLLHDPGLAKKCGITIPTISEKVRASIQEINVYRVESREEARDFIGFKHINGPHKWESFAKARFAADWYKQEKRNKGGLTLHDIAQRMGDRHDTIQRMVSAIFVLDQAAEKKIFEINDRYPSKIFSFSHLYTALTRTGFRSFLGVSDEWKAEEPEPNPIPEDKVSNLNKVLIWIYGSKDSDIQPIVTSQNPHVKQLGQVLENSRARAILLKQGKLEIAFAELEPPGQQFEKNLVEARHYIEEAQRKVESYDGKDATLLQIAEEVTKKSQLIFNVMQQQKKIWLKMSAPGYSLKIPDIDPSETSDSSWVFSAADWLEYDAYLSSSNESYFDSLVDQLNLGRDREPENFGELDEELDDVTNKISAEINRRSIALNGAYPYSFIENGSGIKLKDSLSPGATSYIFSLIISHFTRSEILPGDLVPTDSQIINARNLFQICSTIAAAGECDGPGFSMGWPRDDKTFFLEKLQRIWEHYKDGIPVDTPPADAPESVKDCGVDTVSWWIEKDGRPGRGYLVGQAATGLNWEGKSADTARKFFALWFKEQPRSTAHIATFIPFIINEDEFRWLLRDHNHIINRTRLPARVDKGLTLSKNGIGPIERIEHIPEIENWLNTYKQSVVVPYNAP